MRRVLIIDPTLPLPYYDRRVWLEATTLSKAGYVVSVICPKAEAYRASYERVEDVDIYRYGLPFEGYGMAANYIVEFAWSLIQAIWLSCRIQWFGRGFDAIHACNPPDTYWVLGWFWSLWGKRFLFDHHDLSPEMYEAKYRTQGGVLYRLLLWFERRSLRQAHTVISTNDSYKAIALQRGGRTTDEVFVVRSGPALDQLHVLKPEPALKRGRPFLCVYLGKMCEQDGVDYLVRVVEQLCVERKRQDILFVFIGGGPAQPDMRRYASELGVDPYCHFTGYVSDHELCRYLSTADIAIDPDPYTPWSDQSTMNKIMEYMVFGCPIVAFDLKENRVSAQKSAVYVTPNCESEMADQIEALLANPHQRRIMGAYGQDRVRSVLAWEHSIPPLLKAYQHLFRGKRVHRER
jgi:glycosyltransferase involved in cell wall biosynthesis